jgi:hypothetical protein
MVERGIRVVNGGRIGRKARKRHCLPEHPLRRNE